MRTTSLLRGLSLATALTALMGAPRAAQACGGMFCDGGPQPMPVDQKGENILYKVDAEAGTVEAHIQIQYEGAASRFAWVLPVQTLPTFDIGSQLLFDALLQGTVPTYGLASQFACQDNDSFGGNGSPGAGGSSSSAGAGGTGQGPGEPTVVFQKTVGAFDVTVLEGGTADKVIQWLNDNGYQQNPAAEPLLNDYLEKNYFFAAVKLTGGAGVDEIHPLVVKYHGTEPCIPLKLTAIAATENMGVRAFLLGDTRWVPAGDYKHVVLNPARLDWPAQGTNYLDLLTRAVDSAVANGRAFITEYAGPSNVVPLGSVYSAKWMSAPFAKAQPEQVVSLLNQQQLVTCFTQGGQGGSSQGGSSQGSKVCVFNHPLLPSLLEEFLPAPTGVKADDFYACLSCYSGQIDQTKWDAAAFAQRFDERIVLPAQHAVELVSSEPYLTRLFTTISPAEMLSDPEFRPAKGLPDVARVNTGTRIFECSDTVMRLPDDRSIVLPDSGGWVPWPDEMPWAERIEEIGPDGQSVVLVTNTQKIDDLIDAWNKSQGWPKQNGAGTGGASTGGSAGQGGSEPAGQGGTPQNMAGQGGAPQSAAGQGGMPQGTAGQGGTPSGGAAQGVSAAPPPEPGGGCQVSEGVSGTSGLGWLVGLALVALGRRKKENV